MDKTRYQELLKTNQINCWQCGQKVPYTIWAKRRERGKTDWDKCRDCTAKPSNAVRTIHPVLGTIFCYPHKGDVDELWRPLDDEGRLFRPGERICGHKDCINTSHILGEKRQQRYFPDVDVIVTDKIKAESVPRDELTPHNR